MVVKKDRFVSFSTAGEYNQIRLKSQLLSPLYDLKEKLNLTTHTTTLDQ
jgi:hypothetical protein